MSSLSPGYGSISSPVASLPLGEAIRQLPQQYIKVLTKPSAATFAEEMGKAAWDMVWIQLIAYATIAAVLGYLATLITPLKSTIPGSMNPEMTQAITLSAGWGLLILVQISVFIVAGMRHLFARRAFGGKGTFLAQSYTILLVEVPVGVLSGVLRLIPLFGTFAGLAGAVYGTVLDVFVIMAVYRLHGGIATSVVLGPVVVGLFHVFALMSFFMVAIHL